MPGTILVIRRRRPIGEPPKLLPGSIPSASVVEGTKGASRILHSLAELGVPIATVIQSVHETDASPEELTRLDLGRRFTRVAVGSHLVNLPDSDVRRAFLAAARRHLVGDCDVYIEHHPIDWASTAEEVQATPGGSQLGMTDVKREPPWVSAVSVYDIGGRIVRQPFRARVLTDDELDAELWAAGLVRRARVSPTWLLAGPVPDAVGFMPTPA
jgi:hypothetical protein